MEKETVITPAAQATLADCVQSVGCGDQFDLIIGEVSVAVEVWAGLYKIYTTEAGRSITIRRQLRRIARASDEHEAARIWLDVHQETRDLLTIGLFELGDGAGFIEAAAAMADKQIRAKGRPEKPWRAQMVREFDSLWIKAVGRDDHAVDENTPRLDWINELVYCVEGLRLDARHLERLLTSNRGFVSWLPPIAYTRR
jgi:hypothetical protein